MSDTPRTDAAIREEKANPFVNPDPLLVLCYELERENAELRATQLKFGTMMHEQMGIADDLRSRLEAAEKDAARMQFFDDRCSVTFTFKRANGTSAMICGPTDIRAAIDAAMQEK